MQDPTIQHTIPLTLPLLLLLAACSGDDAQSTGTTTTGDTTGDTTGPGTSDTAASTGEGSTTAATGDTGAAMATVSVSFSGLPDPGADFVYEGWLIVGGEAVSAGRFGVDDQGAANPDTFLVDAASAQGAEAYVLTIEPADGDDPAPSDTHVLAGDFAGGTSADLSVAHPAVLGTDFAGAAGSYVLNTPSSPDMADYAQGIWWLDASGPEMAPSLTLPPLPAGWVYEGWVAGPDGPVSTGTFTMADGADSDGAGPTAGPDPAPPFPGQDFVDPPTVLTGGFAAVISVEPDPDNGPEPFVIKPLVDTTIEDVMPPAGQAMANAAADGLPAGTATLTLP